MDPTAAAYILRHSPVHPPILLFVLPSICPVVLQSNCTFVFPSICPLVRPSFRSFVRRSFRPFVSLSFRPFVYVRPSVHLSVRPYVHLFIRPCVRPSLSFRPFVPPPSVCPFLCSSVCPSVRRWFPESDGQNHYLSIAPVGVISRGRCFCRIHHRS